MLKLPFFSAIATFFIGWSISSQAVTESEVKAIASSSNQTQLAKSVHRQVNQYRASLDLAPLEFNALISQQAKIHSENMAQGLVEFGHGGFQDRIEAVGNRISYRSAAENVAYNQGHRDPVATAVAGWIDSDGHRQNMVGNYNLTGIGVATNPQGEYYFTQIFILEN